MNIQIYLDWGNGRSTNYIRGPFYSNIRAHHCWSNRREESSFTGYSDPLEWTIQEAGNNKKRSQYPQLVECQIENHEELAHLGQSVLEVGCPDRVHGGSAGLGGRESVTQGGGGQGLAQRPANSGETRGWYSCKGRSLEGPCSNLKKKNTPAVFLLGKNGLKTTK